MHNIKSYRAIHINWSNRMARRDYKLHDEFNSFYNASYGDVDGDKCLRPREQENVEYERDAYPIYIFKKVKEQW